VIILVYFSRFGKLLQEKSGNPGPSTVCLDWTTFSCWAVVYKITKLLGPGRVGSGQKNADSGWARKMRARVGLYDTLISPKSGLGCVHFWRFFFTKSSGRPDRKESLKKRSSISSQQAEFLPFVPVILMPRWEYCYYCDREMMIKWGGFFPLLQSFN
jgi:hypothetical protein